MVPCSTCGARILGESSACAECGEPATSNLSEAEDLRNKINSLPAWLRWIIALPGIAIAGEIVVRQLSYSGFNHAASGIICSLAITLTIFLAGHSSAILAPSYQKLVGLAIVFATFATFSISILIFVTLRHPPSINPIVQLAVIPIIGLVITIVSLSRYKNQSNRLALGAVPPRIELGLSRAIGISISVSVAAAFSMIVLGVSYFWPSYLPVFEANALDAVIVSGILVTLVSEYEPVKKAAAAWIAAGLLFSITTTNVAYLAFSVRRYGFVDDVSVFLAAYAIVLSSAVIVGTILGLCASLNRAPES